MPSIFRILGQALFRGDATGSGNAVEIADSSGTARVTVANTGRVTVGQDTTVTTETCAVIAAGTTNANLVIAPNGSGALIASIPDGATTGGNARGSYAVDLQTRRNAATNVASSNYSGILGGWGNQASNDYSVVIGGAFNTASGNSSVVLGGQNNQALAFYSTAFGSQCRAHLYGQVVNSSGSFSADSDNQRSSIIYRRIITGTAITELFIDGASARGVISITNPTINARAWRAQIDLVAICATAGGTTVLNDCFMGSYLVGIKRVGATTSLVGAVNTQNEVSDTSMSTSVVTITADDTNEALKIEFTPPTTADGTTVIRVVATAYLTEVGR